MSENNSVVHNGNSDLDAVIEEVKKEFRAMLGKRKDLIIKLGEALEHKVSDSESICEEIKNALRDEIAEGLISNRIIELYCPDKWKKKTKPKNIEKNEKNSFSQQEQQVIPQLVVGTHGNTVTEPAGISEHNSNNDVVACKEEAKCADACPVRSELEDALKKSTSFTTADKGLAPQQNDINELKAKIESLEIDLQSKINENSTLHSRVKDLQSKLEAHIHNDREDKILDIQFEVPFEPLQKHMASSFNINNHIESIWLSARVNMVSKSLTNIVIGKKEGEFRPLCDDDDDT